MVVLRADPWSPGFGADVQISLDEAEPGAVVVDPDAEGGDWSRPVVPPPPSPAPVQFVDGVRRVDVRVLAQDGDRRAWGIFGSYAVGAVRCDGAASFVDERVGRAVIVGGRLSPEGMTVPVGGGELAFEPRATADDSPPALVLALQNLMREEEGRLAEERSGDGMVLADGPLHHPFGPSAVVVGVVKRMVRRYLEGAPADLLPRLRPGDRTPLFALGHQVLDRYAWYQRLVDPGPAWHELAGIVRCEVRMTLGPVAAAEAADRVAAILPSFAGRGAADPRAPQNLTPVAALEHRLRHRLGHPALVRRAILERLAASAPADVGEAARG